MKRMISFVMIFILCIITLSACIDNEKETIEESQLNTHKIKMVLNLNDFLDGPDMIRALDDIQKNPAFSHIEFEIIENQGDYLTKMPVSIASGEQIDIIGIFNPIEKAKWAEAEIILPLDEFIDNLDVDFEQEFGQFAKEAKYDNHTVLIPYQTTSWVMYYNKKVFDNAGIKYPSAQQAMTWTEYKELAYKLTSGEGDDKIYGALHLNWPMFWYGEAIMILGGGTEFYDENGLSNIEDPAFAKALQRTYEMMHVDKSIPTHATNVIDKRDPAAFMTGKYGLYLQGSWLLNWAADKKTYPRDFEIGIAPMPVDEEASGRKSWGVVNGLGIAATSPYPEEAFKVALELSRLAALYTTSSVVANQQINSPELFVSIAEQLQDEGLTLEVIKNGFANSETEFLVEKVTGKNPSEYEAVIQAEVEKYFTNEQSLNLTISRIKKYGDEVIKQ